MKSTYVGKPQMSIGYARTSRNSSAISHGIFELDKITSSLDAREHAVFQRIVDSTKFDSYETCKMLATELCKIKLLKTKLLLVRNFYVKIIQ